MISIGPFGVRTGLCAVLLKSEISSGDTKGRCKDSCANEGTGGGLAGSGGGGGGEEGRGRRWGGERGGVAICCRSLGGVLWFSGVGADAAGNNESHAGERGA